MNKYILYFLIFFVVGQSSSAQDLFYAKNSLGANAGLSLAFGTHVKRIGLCLQFFEVQKHFQFNAEMRWHYNFRAFGPRMSYNEFIFSPGVLFGYGGKRNYFNPFLSSLSNQTDYQNSVAYSYNAYFNKIGTSQQTGKIAIQYSDLSLVLENDLLGKPALDRFRTGAVLLRYQYKDLLQAEIACIMWTGQMGHKAFADVTHFYNKCYMDTSGGRFTNYSHGILAGTVRYHAGWCQTVQASAGFDAEQIRNAVQNHLLHDMRFIPRKINRTKNCHIPMLDENGNQYLYGPEQKIRKAKPYLNLFTNATDFY